MASHFATGNQGFARELCDVLGLPKYTRSFELRVAVDDAVTVKCEYFPELPDGSLAELVTIVRKYDLTERDQDKTAIGDKSRVFRSA